jgi:oligosaccharyltransferase complex subunit delta (ribophorin II)
MRILLVCSLLALLVASALAAPGSYCSKAELGSYTALIKGEIKKGDFKNLNDNLAAIEALSLLKSPITETEKLCESANNALGGDLSSVVVALKIKSALKCTSSKIPDSAILKIEEALTKTAEPVSQLSALTAVSALSAKGIEKSKIDEAVTDLLDHLSSDGFKIHEDMENGSGYLTGLLLEALASLKSALSSDLKNSLASTVVDSVKPYLSSSAVQDDSTLAYPHHDASVNDYASTAVLLNGLIRFNKAFEKKLGFSDEKLNKLARFFLSKAPIASIQDVHNVVLGLFSLNSGTWRKPLIVSASQTTLKASAKGDDALVRFQVTDIFGTPSTSTPKLFIVALTSSESTTPLISNQELTANEKGEFEFNLLAIKPAPGSYKLSLSATPSKVSEGSQPYTTIKATTRFVKVISSIEVSDLSLSVKKSKDASSEDVKQHTFVFGKKGGSNLELSDTDHLELSFSVKSKTSNKPVTVQQAFILISHQQQQQQGSEVFFVAKYDNAKKSYTVTIPLARHIARFGSFSSSSGQFELKLLIGDSFIDNSISWDVCNLNVKLTDGAEERIAKAKLDGSSLVVSSSLSSKDAKVLATANIASYKPEIHHKFRPADKRADPLMAKAFTIIVLAPLALFIVGLLFTGLNFAACPSGLGIIFALAFHALIVVHGYIIALFFFENNLFQTLQLLCYSVPPTIFVGHQALKAIAQKRAQLLAEGSQAQ